jgi:endonuclease YncB( thermonuclease family)
MKALVAAIILLCVPTVVHAQDFKRYYATFHSCYDGDTCYFDFHLGAGVGLGVSLGAVLPKQGVRLCDIDAPEIRGGTAASKAAARKARDALASWLKAAKDIQVEIPQKNNCDYTLHVNCDKTEKYGRWLGYIWADGVNLNKKLLENGLVEILVSKATGDPISCRE